MTAKKDITGKKFGRLTVMKDSGERKNSYVLWLCRCECGEYCKIRSATLINGHTKSCGCLKGRDIVGERFGKLLVIKELDKRAANRNKMWLCKCDCGQNKEVSTARLRTGEVKSCGCLKYYYTGKRNHMYNPDKTDEERMIDRYMLNRKTQDYFRKGVYKRDDYTCRICEKVGGRLQAHHLNGWNWFREGRFDISNGVTLCINCHKEFHQKYGVGFNTLEQFESFIFSKKKHKQLALF